jgi:hypothetical protein
MEPGPLQSNPVLPDPLVLLGGERVATKEDWFSRRRPELAELFQHYMYGRMPPAPPRVESTNLFVEPDYLGGKATLKEVEIRFGPQGAMLPRLAGKHVSADGPDMLPQTARKHGTRLSQTARKQGAR